MESLFVPPAATAPSMAIGAELELIPFDIETRRSVPIASDHGKESIRVMRAIAGHAAWTEIPAGSDPPSWSLPEGGRVSFEPGGQIELSSATSNTASALIRDLSCLVQLMESSFEREGIVLEAVGVDPWNDIADVALQLHRPRYERMSRYFDAIGPSGAKMMRQTASLQINVQAGAAPYARWALLNELSPYITAIFANSPVYAGQPTGHRSYRAHLWRTLDATRTGSPLDTTNPAVAYLDFALKAGAMMQREGPPYVSFGEWMRDGMPTMEDWDLHLSTLFPEVRPRGYFEIRSVDALATSYVVAPIALVAGLTYDRTTAKAAAELLASADPADLETAGREGLDDPVIRATCIRLVDLAVAGCESIGEAYLSRADLTSAVDFFDRYTRQGRSPGDDWS